MSHSASPKRATSVIGCHVDSELMSYDITDVLITSMFRAVTNKLKMMTCTQWTTNDNGKYYYQISWILKAIRLDTKSMLSLWHLIDASAVALHGHWRHLITFLQTYLLCIQNVRRLCNYIIRRIQCRESQPLCYYEFLISAWISNYIYYKISDEVSYPSPNFNSEALEV